MALNLNEAAEYTEFGAMIADGTFCWVAGKIRPGQVSLPGFDQADFGLFKQSKGSDVVYADWEFTVTYGPHLGAKIWQNTSIAGGQLDDKGQSKAGNITKTFLRAIVESAFGINPKDQTPQAQAYRNIPSVRSLEGVQFAIRVGIQEGEEKQGGGRYPDRNTIAKVILPDDPQYADMKAGKEIPPQPSGPRPARSGAAASGAAPAPAQNTLWQTDAAGNQQTPAPAPASPPAPQPQAAPPQGGPAPGPGGPAAAWTGGPAAPGPANGAAGGPQPAGPGPQGPQGGPGAAPANGPAWLNG